MSALYGSDPGEFTSLRKEFAARAKAEGKPDLATTIAKLRKPTAAAAIVNQLPETDLEQILNLGIALREATSKLDSEGMKQLGAQRSSTISHITSRLEATASVKNDVAATLTAAIADPDAARAVASRALVKALHYSGLGEIDLDDVLAHAGANRPVLRAVADPPPDPELERQRQLKQAQRHMQDAQAELDTALRRQHAAHEAFTAARQAAEAADAGVNAARLKLAASQRRMTELGGSD